MLRLLIVAVKLTKVKSHGNNVCDIIIANVIGADAMIDPLSTYLMLLYAARSSRPSPLYLHSASGQDWRWEQQGNETVML